MTGKRDKSGVPGLKTWSGPSSKKKKWTALFAKKDTATRLQKSRNIVYCIFTDYVFIFLSYLQICIARTSYKILSNHRFNFSNSPKDGFLSAIHKT
jgi:hypothetical protein